MKKHWLSAIRRNDYAYTIVTKAVIVLIGVAASSLAKRFFGPAIEGDLAYITSLLTTAAVAGNLGLYQPYPFYKRQGEPGVLDKFLSLFALQFLCYGTLGIVLAVCFRQFVLTAVCVIAPLQVLANQLSFVLMVEEVKYKNRVFLTARIINTLIILLAALTLSPSLLIGLGLMVVGDVVTIVMALRKFGRAGNPFRADMSFLKKILPFSLVAMVTALLLTINYEVDKMMLEWMGVVNTQRGFYSSGASLAAYGWLIPDAFREVLFSRTAKNDAVGEVTASLKINFYLTLLMILAILLLGERVIRLLFGAAYLPSFPVTRILVVGILPMSYFKLIGTLLLAQGKKWTYLLVLLVSGVVNIFANLYTIPRWGIEGAAWSSVLSYSFAGIVFVVYYLRTYAVGLPSLFLFTRGEIDWARDKLRRAR